MVTFLEEMIQHNKFIRYPKERCDIWEVSLDELIILPIFKPYETENTSLIKSKS